MAVITEEEPAALGRCRSESERNEVCDRIKAARGGAYPIDWYDRVMRSGLCARTRDRYRW